MIIILITISIVPLNTEACLGALGAFVLVLLFWNVFGGHS